MASPKKLPGFCEGCGYTWAERNAVDAPDMIDEAPAHAPLQER